jgi:hypothetical protein
MPGNDKIGDLGSTFNTQVLTPDTSKAERAIVIL